MKSRKENEGIVVAVLPNAPRSLRNTTANSKFKPPTRRLDRTSSCRPQCESEKKEEVGRTIVGGSLLTRTKAVRPSLHSSTQVAAGSSVSETTAQQTVAIPCISTGPVQAVTFAAGHKPQSHLPTSSAIQPAPSQISAKTRVEPSVSLSLEVVSSSPRNSTSNSVVTVASLPVSVPVRREPEPKPKRVESSSAALPAEDAGVCAKEKIVSECDKQPPLAEVRREPPLAEVRREPGLVAGTEASSKAGPSPPPTAGPLSAASSKANSDPSSAKRKLALKRRPKKTSPISVATAPPTDVGRETTLSPSARQPSSARKRPRSEKKDEENTDRSSAPPKEKTEGSIVPARAPAAGKNNYRQGPSKSTRLAPGLKHTKGKQKENRRGRGDSNRAETSKGNRRPKTKTGGDGGSSKDMISGVRSESNGVPEFGAVQQQGLDILSPVDERLALRNYVNQKMVKAFAEHGVMQLFPWQAECLQSGDGSALGGGNLIYSAPTSGGKTLVAEILMIKALSQKGGAAIFVVPFVALAEEKAEYFSELLAPLGHKVQACHGSGGDDTSIINENVSVLVCTIERANIIVNSLLGEGGSGLRTLSVVVVDELHLLGDKSRGYILELLLTKLRHAPAEEGRRVQIVGLSATLPNLEEIAAWLDATSYKTEHRPVQLSHRICQNLEVYDSSPGVKIPPPDEKPRCIRKLRTKEKGSQASTSSRDFQDKDGIISLCEDALRRGHRVLVFCSGKSQTLNCAQLIETHLWRENQSESGVHEDENGVRFQNASDIRKGHVSNPARASLLDALRQSCPTGVCPILAKLIERGIAYHHGGLVIEERRAIESGFRGGALKILVATTTLAAGVNLPAQCVIIRSTTWPGVNGFAPIDVPRYLQMAGRAGRYGLETNDKCSQGSGLSQSDQNADTGGECFLILKRDDKLLQYLKLPSSPLPNLTSELITPSKKELERAVLEIVTAKISVTREGVHSFMSKTLVASQYRNQNYDENVTQPVNAVLTSLNAAQFLAEDSPESGGNLEPTQLGMATFKSAMSPADASIVFNALELALSNLILSSDLHILYLVSPPSPSLHVEWGNLSSLMGRGAMEESPCPVATAIGVKGKLLRDLAMGGAPPAHMVAICKRFYIALILQHVVEECSASLNSIMKNHNIDRGALQALQMEAATSCGQISSFCKHLNYASLALICAKLQPRLCYGTKPELLPLVRLGRDVPSHRARALFNRGLTTVPLLAAAEVSQVLQALEDVAKYHNKDRNIERKRVELAERIIDLAREEVKRLCGGGGMISSEVDGEL